MTNSNKTNKLVATKGNKWSDIYGKIVVDRKTYDKFSKKINKHNKGLAKDKQISKVTAGSEALKLWIEKNPI